MLGLLQKFNSGSASKLFFEALKAWRSSRSAVRHLLAITLSLVLFSIQSGVSAQTLADTDARNSEVDALLADIQSQQKTRSVYNQVDGFIVAEVPIATPYKVVKRIGAWRLVTFNKRLVLGWVSADYVSLSDGVAKVDASNLNVRLTPSPSAKIVATIPRNYQARVQGQRTGFVKLALPSSRQFAILKLSSAKDTSENLAVNISPPVVASSSLRDAPKPKLAETQQQEALLLSEGSLGAEGSIDAEGSIALDAEGSLNAEGSSDVKRSSNAAGGGERLHQVSPGDAISLLVFGERDLSIENVRVPQSGRVSFPLIGSVLVAGKTTAEIESSVSKLLAQGYVRNPRLSVTIFSYRPIFIRGAVRETGSYPFTEGLTIAKAIALAGGSKNSAKLGGVRVSRDGQVVAQGLDIDSEVEISSGDVISVAEEVGVGEDAASYIYLHGEVASPGEYLYRRGLTVEKAIVLAGGFTIRASRKKVSVTRYTEQDEDGKPKRLRRVKLYEPIKPGDVIVVGASWF